MKKNLDLSAFTRVLHGLRYGDQVRPYRDWMVLISIAALLFILSVGWSYFVFRSISEGTMLTEGASATAPVDAATIESVRTLFDRRVQEQAHYLSDYHFVDPGR